MKTTNGQLPAAAAPAAAAAAAGSDLRGTRTNDVEPGPIIYAVVENKNQSQHDDSTVLYEEVEPKQDIVYADLTFPNKDAQNRGTSSPQDRLRDKEESVIYSQVNKDKNGNGMSVEYAAVNRPTVNTNQYDCSDYANC